TPPFQRGTQHEGEKGKFMEMVKPQESQASPRVWMDMPNWDKWGGEFPLRSSSSVSGSEEREDKRCKAARLPRDVIWVFHPINISVSV
ncbi:hypothetical protein [truncated ORF], partial [Aspergillus niger]|uniref:Uncharacterized protein n=2 Tax=Aspergillus niger TaxID=5061 RepID=A0AAJ8BRG9_ASPNG